MAQNSLALSVKVLAVQSEVKHVLLMGNKEIIARFPALSAQEVLEVLVSSYNCLHHKVPLPFEYFIDFLKFALLDISIEIKSRYPKRGLLNFINNEYMLM